MPQATMEEEDQFKLPEDTLFPAELIKVEEKSFPFTYKKGDRAGEAGVFVKWEWEFLITGGDYAGLHVWGESEDKLTTHPDNKVRQWSETLRDAPFELGEGVNTDDYIGLPCTITVSHEVVERSGSKGNLYKTPLKDVFPAGLADEAV